MYPFLIFGYFSLTSIESFYNMSSGVFLWLAVALLLGGAAHLVHRAYRESK
jgi:high-affinity Fe2+/Pb2+ permease